MIKTENLSLNKRNKIDMSQRIIIECDECNKQFESSLRNRESHIPRYSKDLCSSCKQVWQYKNGFREKQKQICINNAKFQKGKTFEELYGVEKSLEISKKLSISNSGENNPMFGKNDHCKNLNAYNTKNKGKSNIEKYGIEKALEISKKLSISNSGENNPMFGKPSPTGSGNGWSGWYDGIYFRSLLELSYLHYLVVNNIKFESGEKRKHKFTYELNNKPYNYFCDFVLLDSLTYIEVKPKNLINTVINTAKFSYAKLQQQNFKIITEDQIKKLTYEELKILHDNNKIKFLEKYETKFKNYFDKINKKGKK